MAVQIKKCPYCNRVYESGQYREKIGEPIKYCVFCMKSFIDKNTNEWQTMRIGGKIWYILFVLLTIFGNGILTGMVALLVLILPDLIFKTTFSHFVISNGDSVIRFGIVFMVLTAIYILIREGRDISASIKRMKDENYRETLKTAGLLK